MRLSSCLCLLKMRLTKLLLPNPIVIDEIVKKLKSYNDKELSERLYGKEDEIKKLVDEYLHC